MIDSPLSWTGRDIVAMAIGAFAGGIFVDDNLLACGGDCGNVALGAGNVGVAAS